MYTAPKKKLTKQCFDEKFNLRYLKQSLAFDSAQSLNIIHSFNCGCFWFAYMHISFIICDLHLFWITLNTLT